MKPLSLWTYIMTMLLRLSLITLCIYVLSSWLVHADVWFIEAEGFEEKRSILATNQKGVNVQWSIKEDDKKALSKKYLTVEGANRNNCEACAPLFIQFQIFAKLGSINSGRDALCRPRLQTRSFGASVTMEERLSLRPQQHTVVPSGRNGTGSGLGKVSNSRKEKLIFSLSLKEKTEPS